MTWLQIIKRRLKRVEARCGDPECEQDHPHFWDWF